MRRLLLVTSFPIALAVHHRDEGAQQAKSKWHDASFFDSFQTGESTYEYDAAQVQRAEDNPYHEYADGWNPDVTDPLDPKEVDPLWFASLPSGGPDQALQTLPEPNSGPFGHNQDQGHWYQDSGGKDVQSYKYPTPGAEQGQLLRATGGDVFHLLKGSGKKQANWFDASVSQYDAYGRPKNPYPGNPSILIMEGYQQQATNASLACKDPGCNASATLSLGQDRSELRNCKLSVQVRPTDVGPEKVVEYIKVNDRLVSLNCQPKSPSQCNQDAGLEQLYTCVDSVDVQHLLNSKGSIDIAAKISDNVNRSDCAYQGNLFYAIPQLACLVGKPPSANTTGFADTPQSSPVDLALREKRGLTKLAMLQEHAEHALRGRGRRGLQGV